jgi:hypothetical protein
MPLYKGSTRTVVIQSLNSDGSANTVTVPTCQVSYDGGAFAGAGTPTHVGNGAWKLSLALGGDVVVLTATGSGLIPAQREFYTEADYTAARAPKLDNLDAAVSSRSTLTAAQVDTQLSTSHGSGAWGGSGGTGLTIADVQTALTNQGYTTTLAGNLATRIDATIGSRLAASAYAAPPTAAAVATQVDTTLSVSHGSGAWGGSGGSALTKADLQAIPIGGGDLYGVFVAIASILAGAASKPSATGNTVTFKGFQESADRVTATADPSTRTITILP